MTQGAAPVRTLRVDQVFDGRQLHSDQLCHVDAEGVLQALEPARGEAEVPGVCRVPGTLSPGLFDLQVNGGSGRMFNSEPTAECLAAQGQGWRAVGTRWWLPTFITDDRAGMVRAAEAIEATVGQHGVAGLHLEGPHISLARRGVHAAGHIRPLDDTTLDVVHRLRAQGIPVLLTLAPECVSPRAIEALVACGVRVSLGHTSGSAAQVQEALDAGATLFTHLHNAMTPLTSREPGAVGAALDSTAWCGIIADGHHVSDPVLRVSFRARPVPDRMVLVSDAMATANGPDTFDLYGETIRVQDGRLINAAGSLAGAHITLAESVSRLIRVTGIDPCTALRAATHNPAAAMGLLPGMGSVGTLGVGAEAGIGLLQPGRTRLTDCWLWAPDWSGGQVPAMAHLMN